MGRSEVHDARFPGIAFSVLTDAMRADLAELLPKVEALYKDIHAHPELSMQEVRTAGLAAAWLEEAGFEDTGDCL